MVSCRYDANEKRVVWDIKVTNLSELLEAFEAMRATLNSLHTSPSVQDEYAKYEKGE